MLFACKSMFAVLVGKVAKDLSNSHCVLHLGRGHVLVVRAEHWCVQTNHILAQWKGLSLIFQNGFFFLLSPVT